VSKKAFEQFAGFVVEDPKDWEWREREPIFFFRAEFLGVLKLLVDWNRGL
jgi:hypothetical protein